MSETEPKKGFTILPPGPGVCQECGKDHDPALPHNALNLGYMYRFYANAGRWPTWKDAVAHCIPSIQKAWEDELRKIGKWTEPTGKEKIAKVNGDGTIGSVETVPIEQSKRAKKKKPVKKTKKKAKKK